MALYQILCDNCHKQKTYEQSDDIKKDGDRINIILNILEVNN